MVATSQRKLPTIRQTARTTANGERRCVPSVAPDLTQFGQCRRVILQACLSWRRAPPWRSCKHQKVLRRGCRGTHASGPCPSRHWRRISARRRRRPSSACLPGPGWMAAAAVRWSRAPDRLQRPWPKQGTRTQTRALILVFIGTPSFSMDACSHAVRYEQGTSGAGRNPFTPCAIFLRQPLRIAALSCADASSAAAAHPDDRRCGAA